MDKEARAFFNEDLESTAPHIRQKGYRYHFLKRYAQKGMNTALIRFNAVHKQFELSLANKSFEMNG